MARPPRGHASMPAVRHRPPTQSKSAAVRLAALYPSRRQLRKWNRERRFHRALIVGVVGVVGIVVLILAFGYLRENVMRANEVAATVNGETITLAQVLERVKPRAAALDAQAQFYQAQGLAQAADPGHAPALQPAGSGARQHDRGEAGRRPSWPSAAWPSRPTRSTPASARTSPSRRRCPAPADPAPPVAHRRPLDALAAARPSHRRPARPRPRRRCRHCR